MSIRKHSLLTHVLVGNLSLNGKLLEPVNDDARFNRNAQLGEISALFPTLGERRPKPF